MTALERVVRPLLTSAGGGGRRARQADQNEAEIEWGSGGSFGGPELAAPVGVTYTVEIDEKPPDPQLVHVSMSSGGRGEDLGLWPTFVAFRIPPIEDSERAPSVLEAESEDVIRGDPNQGIEDMYFNLVWFPPMRATGSWSKDAGSND